MKIPPPWIRLIHIIVEEELFFVARSNRHLVRVVNSLWLVSTSMYHRKRRLISVNKMWAFCLIRTCHLKWEIIWKIHQWWANLYEGANLIKRGGIFNYVRNAALWYPTWRHYTIFLIKSPTTNELWKLSQLWLFISKLYFLILHVAHFGNSSFNFNYSKMMLDNTRMYFPIGSIIKYRQRDDRSQIEKLKLSMISWLFDENKIVGGKTVSLKSNKSVQQRQTHRRRLLFYLLFSGGRGAGAFVAILRTLNFVTIGGNEVGGRGNFQLFSKLLAGLHPQNFTIYYYHQCFEDRKLRFTPIESA